MPITPPPPPKKVSSMLGSLVSSKKRILNGRNNSSAPDTAPTNSSAILNQGSTSNGRDLRPYWNGQVAEWSQKLWLPIVTDLPLCLRPHPVYTLPPYYKTCGSLRRCDLR